MRWRLPWILMLAGCGAGGLPSSEAPSAGGRDLRVAAECRMLAAAQAATVARGQVAVPDVLVGCPGHDTLRETMPVAAQTAALRAANRAVLPPAVLAAGPRGAVVYRRMVTRGVPEAVAAEVAQGPLFRVAAGGRG